MAGSPTPILSDLTVTSVNATDFAGFQSEFSATLPGGAGASNYTWWWGDGTVTTELNSLVPHAYSTAGIYLVYVQATDRSGGLHDNAHSLLRHTVLPSATNDLLGNLPEVAGAVVGNTTTNTNATAVIAPGGFVSVENWVTNVPSNPQWDLGIPSYSLSSNAGSNATLSSSVVNATGISGVTVGFRVDAANGSYAASFSVPSTGTLNGTQQTAWANFTFTIFVENASGVPVPPAPVSPHPGWLRVYLDYQFLTWDPAVLYDTFDAAFVQNLLQTLIFRNISQSGSAPEDFVPDLSTCVPGSSLCSQLYGTGLIDAGGNYTFVVNPNASFYNPTTGRHWPVYPNDVAFSLARDCLVADWGYPQIAFGGWDLCQTVLPSASAPENASNQSWDGGLHFPYNNTPANILAGVVVNDSVTCPAGSPMRDGVHGDGCVTFVTSRSGAVWPQFLAFLSNPWTGVLSCAWTSTEGFGLSGWGDGTGCIGNPPGEAGNPNAIPNGTAWDANITQIVSTAYGDSPLRYDEVGSAPYYLSHVTSLSYGPYNITLAANPDWGGTTCIGGPLAGCLPPNDTLGGSPTFAPLVSIYTNATGSTVPGKQALTNGVADLVDLLPGDIPFLVSLVAKGAAGMVNVPGISINALGLNLNYSVAAASQLLGNVSSLPSTLLQDYNLREFLFNAYPWPSVQKTVCTPDGIQTCFQFSGGIPAYLTGYTPSNLTWPGPDPSANQSVVGSAGWWWAQAEADGIVSAHCTPTSPCRFPASSGFFPAPFPGVALWAENVNSISGGALQPVPEPVTFGQWAQNITAPPGTAAFAAQGDGWVPDNFDPSNYLPIFYGPEEFGYSNGLAELLQPQYESACTGPIQDPQVDQACQGTAYQDLESLLTSAASCALPGCPVTQRELLYNEADHIAFNLGLYIPEVQGRVLFPLGPWIDPSSIGHDPVTGSFGTVLGEPLFDVRYFSVIPPVYPLVVGVPLGTPGSVTAAHNGSRFGLETGEHIQLLVGLAGGSGIYDYNWSGLPLGCPIHEVGVVSCIPTAPAKYTVQSGVQDSRDHRELSPAFVVPISLGPTISGFSASPGSVVLGSNATFSLSATGGFGGLRLSYAGLPPGCSSNNTTLLVCQPSVAGTFTITASARDVIGVTALAEVELTVIAPTPSPTSGRASWLIVAASAGGVAVGGTLAGLQYTRISRETVLQTKVRFLVYEFVRSAPGASFSTIRDAVGLQNGAAAYHLRVLEKQGLLHSEVKGRRHLYFPDGDASVWRELPVSAFQHRILTTVEATPGIGVRDLGRSLGRGPSSVGYNVRALSREGLIRTERDGLRLRCYSTSNGNGLLRRVM